jgi:hypothetical protein
LLADGQWLPMIDALHSRRMSGTKQKARSDAGFCLLVIRTLIRTSDTFSQWEKEHQPEIASRSW